MPTWAGQLRELERVEGRWNGRDGLGLGKSSGEVGVDQTWEEVIQKQRAREDTVLSSNERYMAFVHCNLRALCTKISTEVKSRGYAYPHPQSFSWNASVKSV